MVFRNLKTGNLVETQNPDVIQMMQDSVIYEEQPVAVEDKATQKKQQRASKAKA